MLSKRLSAVASLITTESVIDVGCDHGYLDIYLTKKGLKCRATDISVNALNTAINNFKKYNLDIETICTDGLNNIKINKTDTIVIAGMGADAIVKILNRKITNDLVILTHNHLERLRRYKRIEQYPEDMELLEDVTVEYQQAIEMTSIYRDVIDGTRQLLSSVIDNRLNNVMKRLTSLTVLMAIPTIISGLWGMNTAEKYMPFATVPYGFAIICIGIVVVCIFVIWYMKKKKML